MTMDPAERRNVHFVARAEARKARGAEVRPEQLKREVAEDLRLLDRMRSEGAIKQPSRRQRKKFAPKLTDRPLAARPELHAEALARKSGSEFFARAVKDEKPRATPAERLRGVDLERLIAMQKRVSLLLERGAGRLASNQTMDKAPFLYPKFATEIGMTTIAFNAGLGSYKGLGLRDRRRRYYRALEDICNRSNAVIGVGWWTPK